MSLARKMNSALSLFQLNNLAATATPSPLSPRSLNLPSTRPLFYWDDMSTSNSSAAPLPLPETSPAAIKPKQHVGQPSTSPQPAILRTRPRPSANPLVRTDEQSRQQRRHRYLNRVQQQRGEDRWTVRGDQILQWDYIKEQRAWEAQQAEAAPALDPDWDWDWEDTSRNNQIPQPAAPSSSIDGDVHNSTSQRHPWSQRDPHSQPSQKMETSQQLLFSQPSQHQYRQYNQPHGNVEDESFRHDSASYEEEEIDDILAAEQRELEALIAMHESEAEAMNLEQDDAAAGTWEGLPVINRRHETGMVVETGNIPSSPTWGSDDTDFERELLRLGDDSMDVSGG